MAVEFSGDNFLAAFAALTAAKRKNHGKNRRDWCSYCKHFLWAKFIQTIGKFTESVQQEFSPDNSSRSLLLSWRFWTFLCRGQEERGEIIDLDFLLLLLTCRLLSWCYCMSFFAYPLSPLPIFCGKVISGQGIFPQVCPQEQYIHSPWEPSTCTHHDPKTSLSSWSHSQACTYHWRSSRQGRWGQGSLRRTESRTRSHRQVRNQLGKCPLQQPTAQGPDHLTMQLAATGHPPAPPPPRNWGWERYKWDMKSCHRRLRIWPSPSLSQKDATFLLTVGSFLLTVELFLLTIDSFTSFTYNWSFAAYNFSFLTYTWSFVAYSGKVRLIRAQSKEA